MGTKKVKVGTQMLEVDSDFDPDDWEKEMIRGDPRSKRDVKNLREEFDPLRNPEMMKDILDTMRSSPPDLRSKLERIEMEANGYEFDDKIGQFVDEKGKPITGAQEGRIDRVVDKLMVIRNPQLGDFPDYVQKVLRERA